MSARLAIVTALGAALVASSPDARATTPSPWSIAAEPRLAAEAVAARTAELAVMRYRAARRGQAAAGGDVLDSGKMLGNLHLHDALDALTASGAANSPDPALRLRLGEVLDELDRCDAAAPVLEGVARSEAPAALRLEAWTRLAVCFAKLGRPANEIPAYGRALELQSDGAERAVLLANRAEAWMVSGDLPAAIQGYRDALALIGTLTSFEVPEHAPTTYWGLAVALDRSGDVEGAFSAIHMARVYDANDRRIHGPGWFFVPSYDEAWYAALGAWAEGRSAGPLEDRADAYERATLEWERYLTLAPATDLWLPIARARSAACAKERRLVDKELAARATPGALRAVEPNPR